MISHLITYVLHHLEMWLSHGGYWILGIVSILEGLPFAGTVVPGHTLVIAGGFFARLGVLNLWLVMAISAAGAIIGDWIGYEVGKKYGTALIPKVAPYVLMKEEHITKATNLLNQHTGKAFIVGRFTPATRALIPFLAGAINVPKAKFWFFNCIGGLVWAVVSVIIGYIFGASYEIAAQYMGQIALIGVILALLIIFTYRFVNKNRKIFKKYQLTALLISIGSLLIFFRIFEDAMKPVAFFAKIDAWTSIIVSHYQNHVWHNIAKIVSDVLSPTTLGIIMLIMAALFFLRRRFWHDGTVVLLSYSIGLFGGYVLKELTMRERPILMTIKANGWSFPSGHATAAALFFSLLIYLTFKYVHHKTLREALIVLFIICMFAGAMARVYLNVHWLTDAIAGLSLGVFSVSFMVLIVRYTEAIIKGRGAKKLQELK